MEFHQFNPNFIVPGGPTRALGLVVAATLAALATAQSVRAELMLQGLYSFPANPRNPSAAVVQGNDGNFYGTTSRGGASEFGTVFKLTPDGTLTTLSVFNGTNGISPSGLVQGDDGSFYGTTSRGGVTFAASSSGWGTVFQIS